MGTVLVLSNEYLPVKYGVSLAINHLKPNFSGTVAIDLAANSNYCGEPDESTFKLTLHSHRLIITTAKLAVSDDPEEEVALKVSYNKDSQTVDLIGTINPGSVAPKKVLIEYVGQLNTIKTFKDETRGLFKTNYSDSINGKADNYVLATHTQPHGCRTIFPLIDELTSKAPVQLSITTNSRFKVVANAQLESEEYVSMTENTKHTFKPTPPISPSVFGFVIGDLEYVESTSSKLSIPVRFYTGLGDSHLVKESACLVSEILQYISDKLFCVPYPLDKLDFVSLPFLSDGAMENWGIITVVSNHLLHNPNPLSLKQLLAHELIHQWIGNLVTFEEWNDLWLNESVASYLGNYALSEMGHFDDFEIDITTNSWEQGMDVPSSASIHQYMQTVHTGLGSSTATIFNPEMYERGMVLLRMLMKIIGVQGFFKAWSSVLEMYQFKSIKLQDIWKAMNDQIESVDILAFIHAWLRSTAYPIVEVTHNGKQLLLTQNKVDSSNDDENVPFHIPLNIKIVADNGETKLMTIMMTDRSALFEIPVNQIVILNHDKAGFYRTLYQSPALTNQITENITSNQLSTIDLLGLINDYGKVLTETPTEQEVTTFFAILTSLAHKSWKIDFNVLNLALNYLEHINKVFINFTQYTTFSQWINAYSVQLYDKVGKWDSLLKLERGEYNAVEMKCRNTLLELNTSHNKRAQDLVRKLYKNFISSGLSKSFTPGELLLAIFNGQMYVATQKEYKRTLEFAKNSNVSLLNNTNVSNHELQTYAVVSLGYTSNDALFLKTLNFIMTNIDSKLIELALMGAVSQYQTVDRKDQVWHWFNLHYNQWCFRSLRKGSDWSKQIGITLQNIARMVLGQLMALEPTKVKEFVENKTSTLPDHGLTKLVEELEAENKPKRVLASYYNGLVDQL
ncbi:uncharacterized protein KQ657_002772 [Scheffersomyces spartinae]|uniref:Aminopeptidase n=1 Tax=Scheffersomyces spartinae TaxID=45513 RepID=A0A9P7V5T4_9ASCO|nr:uncharacterized protein KQ657_002772 [Scheffersomyces spartinae]KAG7191807.1 hypothetical protein KQ657_002772 [Scheffersomyces spartinae]